MKVIYTVNSMDKLVHELKCLNVGEKIERKSVENLKEIKCAYCNASDPHSIAYCIKSQKWFCNGKNTQEVEKDSCPSHIVMHLIYSGNNEVRLHRKSLWPDAELCCSKCDTRNLFLLGYNVKEPVHSVNTLICWQCFMHHPGEQRQDWLSVIQDGQIIAWLVAFSSETNIKITTMQMLDQELLWNIDPLKSIEVETVSAICSNKLVIEPPIRFLDKQQYYDLFRRLIYMEAVYERYMYSNSTLRNMKIRWEKVNSKKYWAYIEYLEPCLDNRMKIDVGDVLTVMKEGNTQWKASGRVMKLPGEQNNTLDINITRMTSDVSDEDASMMYRIDFIWRATVYNHRVRAVNRIKEDTLVPRYFVNLLLGCEEPVEEPLEFEARTTTFSAPNLPALNHSQLEAVKYALGHRFTMIQGPPGTGKTFTAATIVYNLVQQQQQQKRYKTGCNAAMSTGKILVVAPSNIAADQLCHRILTTGLKSVRLYSGSKEEEARSLPNNGLKAVHLLAEEDVTLGDSSDVTWIELVKQRKYTDLEDFQLKIYLQEKRKREVRVLEAADVICCTCVSAADRRLDTIPIDVVVVDEAAQAVEPDCLISLMKARQQVILIGDHKQLGPMVHSPQASKAGLSRSLYDRLCALKWNPLCLQVQYRMHPALIEFPNKQFYNGRLRNGVNRIHRQPVADFPWPNPDRPMFLRLVVGREERGWNGVSYLNRAEALDVTNLIKRLLDAGVKAVDIGVITPYRAQRDFLSKQLDTDYRVRVFSSDIQVKTIDGFQGQEKDYILMSCVRSGAGIGFVACARRMNVAITRARRGLIIVGNGNSLGKDPVWRELMEYYRSLGLVARL